MSSASGGGIVRRLSSFRKRVSLDVEFAASASGDVCGIHLCPVAEAALGVSGEIGALFPQHPDIDKATVRCCGHTFHALSLLYHFVGHSLSCPTCRAGDTANTVWYGAMRGNAAFRQLVQTFKQRRTDAYHADVFEELNAFAVMQLGPAVRRYDHGLSPQNLKLRQLKMRVLLGMKEQGQLLLRVLPCAVHDMALAQIGLDQPFCAVIMVHSLSDTFFTVPKGVRTIHLQALALDASTGRELTLADTGPVKLCRWKHGRGVRAGAAVVYLLTLVDGDGIHLGAAWGILPVQRAPVPEPRKSAPAAPAASGGGALRAPP